MIEIRTAKREDAERLREIYAYYVAETAISFEYKVPSVDEFAGRIERTLKKYPYLVIVRDGRTEGYAYAGPLKERAAYDPSCEVSIYIDRGSRRGGLGGALYAALEDELKKIGIVNLYACVAYPEKEDEYLTTNSADFHEHLGFRTVGRFHGCAKKFGRWYDMIWMEKIIGAHAEGTNG